MKKKRIEVSAKKCLEITDVGKARAESPEFAKEMREFAKEIGRTLGPQIGTSLATFRIALALAERENEPPSTEHELSEFLQFMGEHSAEIDAVGFMYMRQLLLRHMVKGPIN